LKKVSTIKAYFYEENRLLNILKRFRKVNEMGFNSKIRLLVTEKTKKEKSAIPVLALKLEILLRTKK